MDQFYFNKKFTCDIVVDLQGKRINSSPRSIPKEHEADFFSKNDNRLPRYAKKGKEQFNSSLQNHSERRTKRT
jgi:hypothetical protein